MTDKSKPNATPQQQQREQVQNQQQQHQDKSAQHESKMPSQNERRGKSE